MSSNNPFQDRQPSVNANPRIRTPQRETYAALAEFAGNPDDQREVGIVLPVGCGKSGCITLAPFAFRSKRTLVVAPGLKIAEQLYKDFDPTKADMFYFSAPPLRADGQRMAGRVLYSYPIFRAIQEGYVKRLKALVLNPRTLKYVRRENGQEIEVSLDEVRRLGEHDADFRRSIVTSNETLTTIVDADHPWHDGLLIKITAGNSRC